MQVRPNSIEAWMVAARPRSLLLAISPVLVGASLGYLRTGALDAVLALLALSAALLMQLITNLQNDVGYTVRGGDATGTRIGLPRATSSGLLPVQTVRWAIVILSLLALTVGLALVALRGWPVLAIGIASLLAALAYMGGPRPIAYTPWGEFTVFVFFGLVAVPGTDWVITGSIDGVTLLAAAAIGGIAASALVVNNHRDRLHDAQIGRSTFVVRFGERASQSLFAVLLSLPLLLPVGMAMLTSKPWLLLPCVLAPMGWRLHRDFVACPPGLAFNAILFRAFQLELWFAGLLSLGAVLSAHAHAGV
jgi:1,4-dihydroxy-2-naphthoate octaprenyltransferase